MGKIVDSDFKWCIKATLSVKCEYFNKLPVSRSFWSGSTLKDLSVTVCKGIDNKKVSLDSKRASEKLGFDSNWWLAARIFKRNRNFFGLN